MADLTKQKQTDVTTKRQTDPAVKKTSGSEIDAFVQRTRALQAATAGQRGRLIFALDATASRQPTWDMACQLQGQMFREVSGLDVQLVYYRGYGECRASGWASSAERLANLMTRITCQAGLTQISKVLVHGRHETEKTKVQALVFIG